MTLNIIGRLLCVIAVSGPLASPQLVLAEARGVGILGDFAYVVDGGADVLQVFDISDPANPQLTDELGSDSWNDLSVEDGHAYLVGGWPGLQVIDISDPENPYHVADLDTDGGMSVSVSGNHACVVSEDGVSLRVVNVSSPTNPQQVGYIDLATRRPLYVAVAGQYAYVTSMNALLDVIDISDPTHPRRAGAVESSSGWGHSLAVSSYYAYVLTVYDTSTGHVGLRVVDIHDPENPRELGEAVLMTGVFGPFNKSTSGGGVAVSGDYVFLALGRAGIQVIDISDPANPQHVDSFDASDARGVAVANGYAYVAGGAEGFRAIDIGAYSLTAPILVIARESDGHVVLAWQIPSGSSDYMLQECPDLNSGNWADVTVATPGQYELSNPPGTMFYRLSSGDTTP